MTREEVITALAEVLAGLQVPLSIAGSMPGGSSALFGAADEPYRALLTASGFGWRDAGDFNTWLRGIVDTARDAGHVPAVHHVHLTTERNLTIYVDEVYDDPGDARDVAVELAEKLGLPLDDEANLVSTHYQPKRT